MIHTLRTLATAAAIVVTSATLSLADASKMFPDSVEHFPMADAKADDALSPDEFRDFVELEAEDDIGRSRTIKRFNGYGRAFDALDTDADGAVTRDEIGAAQVELQ